MERDELVGALTGFLDEMIIGGGVDPRVLSPVGVELATRLEAVILADDLPAWSLIGWLYLARSRAVADGSGSAELQAALEAFMRVADVDVASVPEPFRPMVIDFASRMASRDDPIRWMNEAADILEDMQRGAGPAKIDRAVKLLTDAVEGTPVGDSHRPTMLSNLSIALRDRFLYTGDVSDLDSAVQASRDAVQAQSANRDGRAAHLSSLGNVLQTRFELTGSMSDLSEAVEAMRAAIAALPAEHPERAGLLSNLAVALRTRSEFTADMADLAEAIDVAREAVRATPEGHPGLAAFMSNLANTLHTRFEHTDNLSDLDEAVEIGRSALAATPSFHAGRATLSENLGTRLLARFERAGDVSDLDAAIAVVRDAIAAVPSSDVVMARLMSSLGVCLQVRFSHTGDLADLDEAIVALHDSLAAAPARHPGRAGILSNLGGALHLRFQRLGNLPDLDGAVEVLREAIEVTTGRHPDHVSYLSNLGNVLHDRFDRTGNQADLHESVQAFRDAVAVTPKGHPNRVTYLSNLGAALSARFDRTGDLSDIDAAIETCRDALALTHVGSLEQVRRMSNLGQALRRRFVRSEAPGDIDEAIELGRMAVAAVPAGRSDRASLLVNLSNAFRARYAHVGGPADLDEAESILQEALTATPADHPDGAGRLLNLAVTHYTRFLRTRSETDMQAAVEAARAGAFIASASPSIRARCCERWIHWTVTAGDWARAKEGVQAVLPLLPQISSRALAMEDGQFVLGQLQGMATLMAWATLEGGAAADESTAELAWSMLEAARGVLLGQALETRDDLTDLTRHRPDLAEKVLDLRAKLNRDRQPDTATTTQEWATLMAQIRVIPELSRFGLPPTFEQMRIAAGEGTVVAILVTEVGCGALLLNNRGADYLPLPELTDAELIEHANRFLRITYDRDIRIDSDLAPAHREEIHDTLGRLWDVMAQPVLDRLGHSATLTDGRPAPRVWWMPTGPASSVPVHALGRTDQPGQTVLDRVISSYTPTVRVLWHSRNRTSRTDPGEALVVGIDDALGLPFLHFAEAEALLVHESISATGPIMLGMDATHDAVSQRLPTASWVHFACHGFAHHGQPGDGFLALYDRPLHVRELTSLDLTGGHLAMLSACTTATVAVNAVDEPIHLASAFQVAGFTHIIATLWSISDPIAPRFTQDIYRHLITGTQPAEAVHHATRALRATLFDKPQLWASHIHFGP